MSKTPNLAPCAGCGHENAPCAECQKCYCSAARERTTLRRKVLKLERKLRAKP